MNYRDVDSLIQWFSKNDSRVSSLSYYLGTQKCKFSDTTPDLLNQKLLPVGVPANWCYRRFLQSYRHS